MRLRKAIVGYPRPVTGCESCSLSASLQCGARFVLYLCCSMRTRDFCPTDQGEVVDEIVFFQSGMPLRRLLLRVCASELLFGLPLPPLLCC